jgi:putative hemolysin
MKKQKYYWILLILLILVIICIGIYFLFFKKVNNQENSQIANPASVFCINQGGDLDIRTASDGSQTGYCIFKNGKECEEWQFFIGECKNR